MDAFGVTKPMVKSSLARLIQLDEQFYTIEGMEGRGVSGSPNIIKTGLHLRAALLRTGSFSEEYVFRVWVTDEGKMVLGQKR